MKSAILAFALMIGLVACSKDKSADKESETKNTEEPEAKKDEEPKPEAKADAAPAAATSSDATPAAKEESPDQKAGADTFHIEGCPDACKQGIACKLVKADKEDMCNESCEAAEEAEMAMKARDCIFEATSCDKIKACDGWDFVLFSE